MPEPLVSLRNITYEREETILHNASWEIREDQHWVVMGPNGSGKTTLLRILTGYENPTSGEVFTLGGTEDADEGWFDIRKSIGWVSMALAHRIEEDQFAADVVLTGREGIINFWEKPEKEDVEKTIKIMHRIDAWHLRDRLWGQLSQGERQRILIGRALMNESKLLVLDEPCAGLDPVAREHFLQFLEQLMRQKETPSIILVTHHVEEIIPPFSHALLMKQGRVLASGSIKQTITAENLSKTFDAQVSLRTTKNKRLQLDVEALGDKKVF
ncbi:iron complex transport system ATP-binding protein [Rubritalea squalenifaciens DSM 18772]|uniref:Iron complex transport system ATP-binding protein n=1 Tax=Rubritalea squalenifaciens DSM 18772 TaxID=1123071 RepID=A0A1M6RQ47_9BACT|nr:ATP-binding cassette domain-containing protein [Rubritalea squalenifaciens]SHK34596.1 iron complex transport system ATP-binding protein [Rubritalea squalenifaciens DSM 18772]